MKKLVILVIATLLLAHARADDADVARSRFPRLTRGINVDWLQNPLGPYKKATAFNRELAEKETQLIHATGCRHIRLFLNVDNLRDATAPEKPDPAKLPPLDAAIELALKHDLAVIVDPFHYGKGGLLEFPGPNDPEAGVIVQFWAALAKHLAKYDPERVFFELANEPRLDNPQDWYAVELRLLKAMRANAPRHTLIAGYNLRVAPKKWDGIKALTLFPEVADKNVVFNFHYYQPMTITHQGAPWNKAGGKALHDVPYPPDAKVIEALLAKTEDPAATKALERYKEEQWSRDKIEAQLAVAAEWAKRRGVLVTCNEFGVYRPVAPPAARVNWTRDARLSLEKLGIGWTIWGEFGFLLRQEGQPKLEKDILKALGLMVP